MKRYVVAFGLVAALTLLAACRPTPVPTKVDETPTLTATPTSTATSVPTTTPILPPTSTPTPEPTHTAVPTSTDVPPTSIPTSTPTRQPPTPTRTPVSTPTQTPTSTPTLAPTPYAENVEVVGHIGGWVSVVVAQGHYIYAGIGPELAVLDIFIPEQPIRVGYVVLASLVKDIVVFGDYAYVVDGNLHIIDVSDPESPRKIGFLEMYDRSDDIAVNVRSTAAGKTYVYISDGTPDWRECYYPTTGDARCQGRMHIVDVSAPAAPVEVGGYDAPADVLDIAVAGDIAYLAGSDGLWVIDVSDPTTPAQVGTYGTAERIIGVEIRDSYAYAVVEDTGLQVLDVSDSSHLARAGSYEFSPHCFDFAFENYHALIAGDTMYLLGCGSGGVRILDISDPTSPSEAGFYEMPLDRGEADLAVTTGIAVVDPASITGNRAEDTVDSSRQAYAYIGNGSGFQGRIGWNYGGISVVDVSEPAHPVRVGGYDAPGSVWDVGVTDRSAQSTAYACAAAYKDGLQVVDVSDPTDPRQIGAHDVPEATDVLVKGSYVYVADQFCFFTWACQGSIRITDLTDPSAPAEIGIYDPPGGFRDLLMAGQYIYAFNEDTALGRGGSTSRYTLRTVDVSDPSMPVETDVYDLPKSTEASVIAIRNRYVYHGTDELLVLGFWDVGQAGTQLITMDLSAPSSPTELGFCTVQGSDVSALDPTPSAGSTGSPESNERIYVYIAGGDRALLTVDVSDPATPRVVGVYDTLGYVRDVAVIGDYAYVVDHDRLRVIDVSDPVAPTEAGFYVTSWYPRSVRVETVLVSGSEQSLVHLADEMGGLYILRFTPPMQ